MHETLMQIFRYLRLKIVQDQFQSQVRSDETWIRSLGIMKKILLSAILSSSPRDDILQRLQQGAIRSCFQIKIVLVPW